MKQLEMFSGKYDDKFQIVQRIEMFHMDLRDQLGGNCDIIFRGFLLQSFTFNFYFFIKTNTWNDYMQFLFP